MTTTADLLSRGFEPSEVTATRLDIAHPDPTGLGPFCRLAVTTAAPVAPGVYAWVIGDEVRYVGMASFLLHVVNGARLQRAYNDYTYVPASKVAQTSSPRVRINGLLNKAFSAGEPSRGGGWPRPRPRMRSAWRRNSSTTGGSQRGTVRSPR